MFSALCEVYFIMKVKKLLKESVILNYSKIVYNFLFYNLLNAIYNCFQKSCSNAVFNVQKPRIVHPDMNASTVFPEGFENNRDHLRQETDNASAKENVDPNASREFRLVIYMYTKFGQLK